MKVKDPNSAMIDWSNRRQYARVRAQLALQYRVLSETGAARAWNSTTTKNLSASGICFESFHPLSLNTELEVNLKIPFYEVPVVMKARIVRAAEIKAGEVYGVAAAITAIKEKDRQKLQMELEQIDIIGLLQFAMQQKATDVHLSKGHPPMIRVNGQLSPMQYDALDKDAIRRMVLSLLSEEQQATLKENHELCTAVTVVTVDGTYRFRLNVYYQQAIVEATFHLINFPVPTLDELNLPVDISTFADTSPGLVLLTGPSGCGKTTTSAALVDKINSQRASLILTFQSPIEYVFNLKKSIIRQREVGIDVDSYKDGLKQATHQDVDLIVLGDLPDKETLELALDAATCGKLVYVVISSSGVMGVLDKLINMFEVEKHNYIRKVIAGCLKGIISQKLVYDLKDKVEVATEILFSSPAVVDAIRDGIFENIPLTIKSNSHILNMSESLKKLGKKAEDNNQE